MTASQPGANRQLLRMSALLQLEQRARQASRAELPFVMVNETALLLPYQQAALWQSGVAGRVAALSGVARPDPGGPYPTFLRRLFTLLENGPRARELHAVDQAALPPDIAPGWSESLPPQALWVPLAAPDGTLLGGLLLARAEAWSEADRHLMGFLGEAYGHAWLLADLQRSQASWLKGGWRRRWPGIALAAALAIVALLPVRQSVLAPAEVVARSPKMVRAPFDGVVEAMTVTPNATVAKDQALLELDTAELRTKLAIAAKSRDIAQAEYEQAIQQSFTDPRAKARLTALQGRIEQEAAEAAYLQDLIDRARIASPIDGIAVFDDANDWLGRPVTQGQRIIMVADPAEVELEIRLPVADALTFEPGADLAFFLNVAPNDPVRGKLTFAGYRAQPGPDGQLSYRLKAALAGHGPDLRLGLKGSAKIYGGHAPLAMLVLRRPFALLRQWLAL